MRIWHVQPRCRQSGPDSAKSRRHPTTWGTVRSAVSDAPRKPFVTHVLHGARFDGHSVPVDVLPDIAAYRELVLAVARALFFERNPGRKRVPKGFEDGFNLVLRHITDPGCAGLPLERAEDPATAQLALPVADEFDEARDLIAATIAAVNAGRPVPATFPLWAAAMFNAFGGSLREGERIDLSGPSGTSSYDRDTRKKLVLLRETTYEDRCDVIGRIALFDIDRMSFELVVDDRRVAGRLDEVAEQPFAVVRTAAVHRGLLVRVVGRGAFDRHDRLTKFVHIDEVAYAEDEAMKAALDIGSRLRALGELQPGWLDGEGVAMDPAGLDWLARVLELVVAENAPRPHLYPTPDGAVLAEWTFPDAEVSAEFDLGRRRAEVVGTHVRTQATREADFELADVASAVAILDFVTKFGPDGMARA